jgi:hypothetical protein
MMTWSRVAIASVVNSSGMMQLPAAS